MKKVLGNAYLVSKWFSDRLYHAARGASLRVLLYHDIPQQHFSTFQKQIHFFGRKATFIDTETFERMMVGELPIDRDYLLLTFDDAFYSNFLVANSILKPLGIKCLFFVPTGLIDCGNLENQKEYISRNIYSGNMKPIDVPDSMRSMSWEDLSYLVDMGHTIGSHTVSHPKLSDLSTLQYINEELIKSKSRIEEKLKIKVTHFAYPFGNLKSINQTALNAARNIYDYVHSGIRGYNNSKVSPYCIRRDHVDLEENIGFASLTLNGRVDFLYRDARNTIDSYLQDQMLEA